ncbi:hypothetical protein [Kitasatospora sp. MMS16-BH015]|uniref:hypothetical protein n=1 Tax=Kitasatospora sp. MMS16-BH015 TaxID=2018025 RepID=UPI000CF29888|nr:hypothetical protein [Kitasatospora sp. MMS16-BH015]
MKFRNPLGRTLGLGTAITALAAAATVAGVGTASAHPGDNVCRSPITVQGYSLQPCVYQDSSGYLHGKVIATGGSTDVYLHIQIGYRCGTSGAVNWTPGTDTSTKIWPGGATLYTYPSSGVGAFSGCQEFSKTWVVNNGIAYGDVEAGPIYM